MDIVHNYIEKGEGEPLILLHGNGEECGYFCHQLEHFCDRFHVIALDTRGHGETPRGVKPFTIRQFADDLAGFMDLQGIQKAHILGFSDGGNIALVFALRYPEKVDRLILDGANLDPSGVDPAVQSQIEYEYELALEMAASSPKAKANAELLALMVNDPNVKPEELSAIKAPTLVMAGTEDMILTEHTRLIAKSIPNARLEFVEGDHFIAYRNYEAFNKVVDSFLS